MRRWLARGLIASLCGCAVQLAPSDGRWIRYDPATQTYSVATQQVTRGELLDDLARATKVEVRPQPSRDETISVDARGLDLEELVARLLPPGTRFVIRRGNYEIAGPAAGSDKRKEGPLLERVPGALAKDEKKEQLLRSGNLKIASEAPYVERPPSGPRIKRPAADLLRVAGEREPKTPVGGSPDRATVRITLVFEGDAPPRLAAAQAIEGRTRIDRLVRGPFLFVLVTPDGRPLHYGTFQDPLLEHSYLPEGQHGTGRAKSGVAGISVPRDQLAAGRLLVIDARDLALPRELTEETVRGALARTKPLAEIETSHIVRALGQETSR